MNISKAPTFLKKAVTAVKSKTAALRTKILILASLHRRMAMVGAISRRIHAIVPSDREKQLARVEYCSKALMLRKAMAASKEPAADHVTKVDLGLFEVVMFDEDGHGYPDWTDSLFDDDNCYSDQENGYDDDLDVLDALDEPSVIEIIRSNREDEGLEFNMDDEIDEACDMFIRRFRSRMIRRF